MRQNKFKQLSDSLEIKEKKRNLFHNNKNNSLKFMLKESDPFELISKNLQRQKHKIKTLRLNEASIFETHNFIKPKKRCQKRAASEQKLTITVTSQSQRKLIQLINPQKNQPFISISTKPKSSRLQNLSTLLSNPSQYSKFRTTYFSSLQKLKKKLSYHELKEQLPEIKLLGWKVKGFVLNQNIILKGVNIKDNKMERYRKFKFTQEIQEKVRNAKEYEKFVKNWLYVERLVDG